MKWILRLVRVAFVLSTAFIVGCADKAEITTPIQDLNLPQEAIFYTNTEDNQKVIINSKFRAKLKKEYLKRFFWVWESDFKPAKKADIFWGLGAKSGFGESKRAFLQDYVKNLEKKMKINSYPSLNKRAIMVKTASVRLFPTIKPRFNKVDGYPFDRWQNSLIFAYTPIRVLHYDSTKEWVLIQSSFVSGWVKSDEVAFMSDEQVRNAMSATKFIVPKNDYIPLYDKNKNFVQNARIGMLLQAKNNGEIYIYKRNFSGKAVRESAEIKKRDFENFPRIFTHKNIATTIDSLYNENYGWGGMYENRDCSSFLRDIFMNFGIWLPRNSKAQVLHGKKSDYSAYIELPEDNEQKLEFLREFAKPFQTIVWMQGHIMLYIGEIEGKPLVIHDVWGISTTEGFEIIGGIAVTTLQPGLEKNSSTQKTLLDRIKAINIIIN